MHTNEPQTKILNIEHLSLMHIKCRQFVIKMHQISPNCISN